MRRRSSGGGVGKGGYWRGPPLQPPPKVYDFFKMPRIGHLRWWGGEGGYRPSLHYILPKSV
eukprot:scaffold3450_cov114-Cylindrotheca_fusiformis.AAC.23